MKRIDLEILIDYFTGSISKESAEQVDLWANQNETNKKLFDNIKRIWNTEPEKLPRPDTKAALNIVLERIGNKNRNATVFNILPKQKENSFSNFIYGSKLFRAAAAVILICGAVYLAVNIFINKEPALVELTCGGLQKIVLNDGTIVTLDAGSRFKYPEKLKNLSKREVYLNGEAYFEVARNEKAPFVVHANKGLIIVLGTKFNIRAWEKTGNVVVAVAEGKVSLQNISEPDKENVILTNGKMSRLSEDGTISPPADIDIFEYLSWQKHEKYFNDTPLSEIINQLERWYNVKIELTNSSLLNNGITVFIENKPLEENLKLLCTLMNMKYEIKDHFVKLISIE